MCLCVHMCAYKHMHTFLNRMVTNNSEKVFEKKMCL